MLNINYKERNGQATISNNNHNDKERHTTGEI
jgi:hypothetical protein